MRSDPERGAAEPADTGTVIDTGPEVIYQDDEQTWYQTPPQYRLVPSEIWRDGAGWFQVPCPWMVFQTWNLSSSNSPWEEPPLRIFARPSALTAEDRMLYYPHMPNTRGSCRPCPGGRIIDFDGPRLIDDYWNSAFYRHGGYYLSEVLPDPMYTGVHMQGMPLIEVTSYTPEQLCQWRWIPCDTVESFIAERGEWPKKANFRR